MLDEAGFPKAVIVASNDLNEEIIDSLKEQGATIGVWGVGTQLVTAYDQPALGGVYKLGAMRAPGTRDWQPRVKVSEQAVKTTTPGILQVRRYRGATGFIGDLIYDQAQLGPPAPDGATVIIDAQDPTRGKRIPPDTAFEDLLVPIFRGGRCVYECPPLAEVRARRQGQLASLHASIKRFMNPHEYPVGLEPRLHALKTELVLEARGLTV
jgi:nicotinate phosphoribosyltransferase